MKHYIKFYSALLVFLILGCDFNHHKATVKTYDVKWERLVITSEGNTKIQIDNTTDSTILIIYHKGTIFTPRPNKIKIDTSLLKFNETEKDSLFLLSKKIIGNGVMPRGFCTDYVGHLSLAIDYGEFRQSCEYFSSCNWPKLSPETQKLYDILKRKLPNTYLGENQPN